jgi:hypothetical protein
VNINGTLDSRGRPRAETNAVMAAATDMSPPISATVVAKFFSASSLSRYSNVEALQTSPEEGARSAGTVIKSAATTSSAMTNQRESGKRFTRLHASAPPQRERSAFVWTGPIPAPPFRIPFARLASRIAVQFTSYFVLQFRNDPIRVCIS